MKHTIRSWPAVIRLVGILGVALALSVPQAALAAGGPEPAPVLVRGEGYLPAAGSPQVKVLQRRLQALGEHPGPADGRFGPRTEAAVRRLQLRAGIAVDGVVGPQTRAALRRAQPRPLARGAGYALPGVSEQVEQIQRQLQALGQGPGPIDGRFGPLTEAAVKRLQTDRRLVVDGVVGPRTRVALAGGGQPSGASDRGTTPRAERRGSRPERPRSSVPAPVPDPQARPARAAPSIESEAPSTGGDLPVVAILLGAALLVACVALFARRTRRLRGGSESSIVAIGRGLELAGRSADPEIGPFRGTAYAVQLPDVEDAEERAVKSRFLVLDRERERRFWVSYSEIETPLPPALQAHPEPWEQQGTLRAGSTVLAYVTVPDAAPARHAELYAQLAQIEDMCKRRGFHLIGVVRDVDSSNGRNGDRPGLAYIAELLESEHPDALVVCGIGRLGHSRAEIDELLGRLSSSGAAILTLEPPPVYARPSGRRFARTAQKPERAASPRDVAAAARVAEAAGARAANVIELVPPSRRGAKQPDKAKPDGPRSKRERQAGKQTVR